jgi:DNA polymerase-3 subunit alpha
MPEPSEYTGSSGFAHLHCHSIYSALDGVATIEEYAEKCVDNGWPGMAITEHGHMGSVPDFHFEFKKICLFK